MVRKDRIRLLVNVKHIKVLKHIKVYGVCDVVEINLARHCKMYITELIQSISMSSNALKTY